MDLAYIAEFTADLRHVPGISNAMADALSRLDPVPPPQWVQSIAQAEQPAPSAAALAAAQATCPDVAAMQQSTNLTIATHLVDGVQLLPACPQGRSGRWCHGHCGTRFSAACMSSPTRDGVPHAG